MPTIPSVGRRFFSYAKMAVFSQFNCALVRAVVIAKKEFLHCYRALSRLYIADRCCSALKLITSRISVAASAVLLFALTSSLITNVTAQAQTPNTTLNYQARILNSSGSLVPDGNYHIEFKIYDNVTAGGQTQGTCSG